MRVCVIIIDPLALLNLCIQIQHAADIHFAAQQSFAHKDQVVVTFDRPVRKKQIAAMAIYQMRIVVCRMRIVPSDC